MRASGIAAAAVLAASTWGQVSLSPSGAEVALSQSGHWVVGRAYTLRITRTGGVQCGPLLANTSGLPANLTWTASGNVADLAGTFTAPGDYRFTVSSTCADGITQGNYTIRVGGPFTMVGGPWLPPCNVGVGCIMTLTQGGAHAYSVRVTSGSLPAGCELVDSPIGNSATGAQLACMATTAGTYTFQIAATDGMQQTLSQGYTLVVGPPAPFHVSQSSLAFNLLAGAPAQSFPIAAATADGTVVNFSVRSDAPWLTSEPTSGKTPAGFAVVANPGALAKGTYTGRLTVTPDGGKQPVTIAVTVAVSDPAGLLGAAPDQAEIDIPPGDSSRNFLMSFHAWNEGSLGLTAQASAITSSAVRNWLTVQPSQVSLAPGQTRVLSVSVDATGLPAGTHQGSVEIRSGTQARIIPITVIVPKVTKVPILSLSGNSWSSGPNYFNLSDTSFDVQVASVMNDEWSTVMDFTTAVEGFRGLARVTPAQGRSTAGTPVPAYLSINQARLGPGAYEGLLTVTAPGAKNSPAYAKLRHTLTNDGAESGSATPVEAENDAPIVAGKADAKAQLRLINPSNAPVNFTVVCPGGELLIDNPSGVIDARGTATVTAKVDGSKLTNSQLVALWEARMWGLYNSVTSRGAQTLILPPTLNFVSGLARHASNECIPTKLFVAPAAPADYFSRLADWPVEIRAAVVDDCGNVVTQAAVTASFSTGDAGVPLKLTNSTRGFYSGIWTPGAAGNVTITVRASKDSLLGSGQIFGQIAEDAGAPVIFNGGIVNNVFPVRNAPASPAAIVAIYGRNLAAATAQAQSVPLPRQLGGVTVLIGGIEAPLFFVSPGQINAQVPAELAGDESYSVVIKTGERYTNPKPLRLAKVSPGIVAFADGRIIAQHPDYSLITSAAPVKPGGYFIAYLVGMGPVTQVVSSGTAAPSSPLAEVTVRPAVSIGGINAEVAFAGLTPGGVGLYQIVVKVPESAPPGDLPLVLTQDGLPANTVTLPVGR